MRALQPHTEKSVQQNSDKERTGDVNVAVRPPDGVSVGSRGSAWRPEVRWAVPLRGPPRGAPTRRLVSSCLLLQPLLLLCWPENSPPAPRGARPPPCSHCRYRIRSLRERLGHQPMAVSGMELRSGSSQESGGRPPRSLRSPHPGSRLWGFLGSPPPGPCSPLPPGPALPSPQVLTRSLLPPFPVSSSFLPPPLPASSAILLSPHSVT